MNCVRSSVFVDYSCQGVSGSNNGLPLASNHYSGCCLDSSALRLISGWSVGGQQELEVTCPSACLNWFHECFRSACSCAGAPTGRRRSALVVTCDLFRLQMVPLAKQALQPPAWSDEDSQLFLIFPPHIIYHFCDQYFYLCYDSKVCWFFYCPCAVFHSKVVTKPKVMNVIYYIEWMQR